MEEEAGKGIIVMTVMGAIFYIADQWLKFTHWQAIDYDLGSYSPFAPIIAWLSWVAFTYITVKNGFDLGRAYYWMVAGVWFVMNLYFTYGVLTTWWV